MGYSTVYEKRTKILTCNYRFYGFLAASCWTGLSKTVKMVLRSPAKMMRRTSYGYFGFHKWTRQSVLRCRRHHLLIPLRTLQPLTQSMVNRGTGLWTPRLLV